jgi:hypothetical protein
MALNVMRFLPEPAATQLNRLRLPQPGHGVITGAQSAEHGAGNARPTSSSRAERAAALAQSCAAFHHWRSAARKS